MERILNYEIAVALDDLPEAQQRAFNEAINAEPSPDSDAPIVNTVRAAVCRVRLWDEL